MRDTNSGVAKVFVVLAIFFAGISAHAQTNNWTDGSSKWETSTNWSLAAAPTNTHFIFITNAVSKTVTIDTLTATGFPSRLTITELNLSAPVATTNTLSLINASATPLRILNNFTIGLGGVLYISNSAVEAGASGVGTFTTEGRVTLDGGSFVVTNGVTTISNAGTGGDFIMNRGLVDFNAVTIAASNSASGLFTMNAGTNVIRGAFAIGANGIGSFAANGGLLVVTNNNTLNIGQGVSGLGVLTVAGADVLVRSANLGNAGVGTLTISSGTLTFQSNLVAGVNTNSSGTIWLTGGQLTTSNSLSVIGNSGTGQMTMSNGTWLAQQVVVGSNTTGNGTLTIAGGTANFGGALSVAASAGATGTVTLTGGSLIVTAAGTTVGGSGQGQLTINSGTFQTLSLGVGNLGNSVGTFTLAGGSAQVLGDLEIASGQAGATGTAWITGGSLTNNGSILVGARGIGQMTMSNGSVAAGALYVGFGYVAGTRGTLTMAGGTLNANDYRVGYNAGITGAVWLTGGQLTTTNNSSLIADSGVGQMTISNGTWLAQDVVVASNITSRGTLTIAGGNVTLGGYLQVASSANATGSLVVAGGSLVTTSVSIGDKGVGQLTISSGSITSATSVVVGKLSSAVGTMTVAGGNSLVGSDFEIASIGGSAGNVLVTGGSLTVGGFLASGSGGNGQMTVSNGAVEVQSSLIVGLLAGSQGTLTVAGGTLTGRGNFRVGSNVGSTGAVWMTGGQLFTTNNLSMIGLAGIGQMTMSNGTWRTRDVVVGSNTTALGTLTVAGGTLQTANGSLMIGAQGRGAMTISSGGVVINDNGFLGYSSSSSNNTVLVTGSGSVWNNTDTSIGLDKGLYIGNYGSGNNLIISNGGKVVSYIGQIGQNSTSTNNSVLVTGSGSVWSNGYNMVFGVAGSGNSLVINNGGKMFNNDAQLGQNSTGNTALVTGSGSVWNSSADLYSGSSGVGNSIVISNQGQVFNNFGYVGNFAPSSNNSVLVTGAGSIWSNRNDLAVGNYGAGNSLTIANGGQVFDVNGGIGINSGYDNGATVSNGFKNTVVVRDAGSVWNNSGNVMIGSAASGFGNQLIVTNGGKVFDASATIGNSSGSSNNSALVTGAGSIWSNLADLVVGKAGANNSLTIANGGAVIAANLILGQNAGSISNVVAVSGGSLSVGTRTITVGSNGLGSVNLSGGAIYAGTVEVGGSAQGFLNVTGGAFNIYSNFFVGGTGGGTGIVNLLGGSVYVTNAAQTALALVQRGTLTLNGGSLTVDNLVVTNQGNFVNLSGFFAVTHTTTVNNGSIVISNGATAVYNSNLEIANTANSTGTVTVATGGSAVVQGNFQVGSAAGSVATVNIQTGSTFQAANNVSIATASGAVANVSIQAGSTFDAQSNVVVASALGSQATVTFAGTTTITNGVLGIGNAGNLSAPGGIAHVIISNNAPVTVASILVGDNVSGGTSSLNIESNAHVIVSGGAGINGRSTTTINGGTLEVLTGAPAFEDPNLHNRIVVGFEADGQLNLSNGTVIAPEIVVGLGTSNKTGYWDMVRGNVVASSNFLVGAGSAGGNVNIKGGSVTVTQGIFAVGNNGTFNSGSGAGRVSVSNADLSVGTLLVGNNQTDNSGLTILSNAHVTVGGGAGINGRSTTTINGGTLEVLPGSPSYEDAALHNRIIVGYGADGQLILSNGTVIAPEIVVGYGASATKTGYWDMIRGTVVASSNFLVGASNATGRVNITGGTMMVTQGIFAVGNNGTFSSGSGAGRVSVSNANLTVGTLLVGNDITDNSGLTILSNAYVKVGGGAGINGRSTTTINGGTLEVLPGSPSYEDAALHNRIIVGYEADGQLNLSNGTVIAPEIVVGYGSSATKTGYWVMAGGMVRASSNFLVGANSASGSVTINGGTMIVTQGVLAVGNNGTFSNGSGAGRVSVSNANVMVGSLLVGNSTTDKSSLTILSNAHVTVSGGAGINGRSTTTINGGTLEVLPGSPAFEDAALHNRIIVGYDADGQLNLSNGTVIAPEIVVGYGSNANKTGYWDMVRGTVIASSNFLVGASNSTGRVTITGGSMVITQGILAVGNNGTFSSGTGAGRVSVSNATVSVGTLLVGNNTTDNSGLTILSNATVTIGGGAGINGRSTTTINGGTLEVLPGSPAFEDADLHNRIIVGYKADGQLILSNGTVVAPEIVVGFGSSATKTGYWDMIRGTVIASSNFLVGASNSFGRVTIQGGTMVVTQGVLAVGNNGTFSSGSGAGRVSVSNANVMVGSILVGNDVTDNSSLTILSNAHVTVSGGAGINGRSTTTINGGTLEVLAGAPAFEAAALHNRIIVGYEADGQLNLSNGTVIAPEIVVGYGSSATKTGYWDMAGGTVRASSNFLVGVNSASGSVTINGGTMVVTQGVFGVGNNGTFTSGSGAGRVTVSNANVMVGSLLVGNNSTDDSGLTIAGTAHVTVTGGAGVNGRSTTRINGGTLEVLKGTPAFEDPMLHNRLIVSYLASGKFIQSGGTVIAPEVLIGATAGKTGTWVMTGGTLTTDSLVATNGAGSEFFFSGGTINVKTSRFNTASALQVGDGTHAAQWNMIGGTHSFAGGVIVSNNATLSAMHTFVHYGGPVVNAGAWITDPTTNVFDNTFTVANSGYISMAAGDVYIFTNDNTQAASFVNLSTNSTQFNTRAGKFLFDATLSTTQSFLAAGHNRESLTPSDTSTGFVTGDWLSASVTNFRLGTLEIANSSTVQVWDAFSGLGGEFGTNDGLRAALYVDHLLMGADSFLIISSNVEVYFLSSNDWSSANYQLLGGPHGFGGELHQVLTAAVPEPNVVVLWLAGLATLAVRRRARRRIDKP